MRIVPTKDSCRLLVHFFNKSRSNSNPPTFLTSLQFKGCLKNKQNAPTSSVGHRSSKLILFHTFYNRFK